MPAGGSGGPAESRQREIMAPDKPCVEISEEQALWFRARRTHLAGDGAVDVAEAAKALVGAQAQQENPALFGLGLRTAGRPSQEIVRAALLDDDARSLVRTWGQRDTLHLYALEDWPLVVAALPEWPQSGRRGGMPSQEDLATILSAFEAAGGPLLRRDLFELIPRRYVDELAEHPGAQSAPERMAATRLIWILAKEGEICFAHREGSEQAYVHRKHWTPELDWRPPAEPIEAAAELARRYLKSFAPATPADLAHFFGSRVATSRECLERLDDELVEVSCAGRKGLIALAGDVDDLKELPPSRPREWPVRLLPQWDTQTMTHKDKTWVLPDLEEHPRVWRKAAVNAATVVARGRFVATWSSKVLARKVIVTVEPLGLWRASYRSAVEREAESLAAHLGRAKAEVVLADSE